MQNINCRCFKNGECLHQAAPRRLFGPAWCILDTPNSDPRVVNECALRVSYGSRLPLPPAFQPPGDEW